MMKVNDFYVSCPKCGWEPDETCRWVCDVCDTRWNTFETSGECPGCGKVFTNTACFKRGGCGQMSPHVEWYKENNEIIPEEPRKTFWFWQKRNEPPVTENDKEWIEHNLLVLDEMLTPEVFKSLVTITPEKQHFDHHFTGVEEDADYILETVASIMNIKPWEIRLMYFSNKPTKFSGGITATPSDNLKGSWKSKNSELIDNGFGSKEIWLDLSQLGDPVGLIATISTELAKYKLSNVYMVDEDLDILSDLTAIAFGFGIFKANSYFKFAQWQGDSRQGWQMQKRGGLPEPLIAYIMAWLAHYRNENISWKQYLNRTIKKYFEKSYNWIEQNSDSVKWDY